MSPRHPLHCPAKKKFVLTDTDTTPETPSPETPSFDQLGLSPQTLTVLAAIGYEEPTPVQVGVIPVALEGKDVLGQARTGTGKTASFAIPILERLDRVDGSGHVQAVILVPTRELAVQVQNEFVRLAEGRKTRSVALYGGHPIRRQMEKLKKGVEIVVGTPGRVLDLIGRQALDLSHVKVAVLDEADRMLDIGFRPDIEKILRRCPQARQTLLLSATVPPPIEKLANRYMQEPVMMNFSAEEVAVETIVQYYFTIDHSQKFHLLTKLIEREQPAQAIIFCRTKRGTERIYQKLTKKHDGVGSIHGDMMQRQRDQVMARFREGKVRYLVATDVVGRGIDVTSISHIINFDIPQDCDDYVHRVGRTARMGRDGVAYTFVTPEEGIELTRIEVRIDRLLLPDKMDGLEPASMQVTEVVEKVDDDRPKPPPPLYTRGGRGPKRHRRGV
jgi:ATP-dependent RNA helicase DeaD